MNNYRTFLLAAPLILLAGCNSGSSNNSSTTKPLLKPAANYQFTDAARDELLEERQDILNSMMLSYDGKAYSNVKFAESLGDENTLIQLADDNGNSIDLYLLGADEVEECIIYHEASNRVDSFQCGADKRSISNDTTLIQTTTTHASLPIQVEYNHEDAEYITSIGSTILTAVDNQNQINITTSFAFEGFFRDLICQPSCDEKTPSTLGVTTFLQLKDITEQYKGSNMTVRFDNPIGGSADDDINMYTGLMINKNQMTTIVTPTGSVFSGGTDLFAAGNERILERATANAAIEADKQVGVHSWAEGDKTAKEFPYTDESHRKQATYFDTVMGSKGIDFYLFTLDSAPASGEHWVTKADSEKYNFITKIIQL